MKTFGFTNLQLTLISTLTLLLSSVSFSEVKTPVQSFYRLNYSYDVLTTSYVVSGGCQLHSTQVELETVPSSVDPIEGNITLLVKIFDVTAEKDECKALVYMTSMTNLEPMISKHLKNEFPEINEKYWNVEIKLPKTFYDIPSETLRY